MGAGSVEFTKNLLGDILSFPELRDAEIALHDIDPERLRGGRGDGPLHGRRAGRQPPHRGPPRPPPRARRRRPRDQHDPGRRPRGHPARLRASRPPTACARRSATRSGIGGIFRALRTIPVMLEIGRRDGRAVPGGVAPELHQPDGHAVLGDLRGHAAAAHRRAVPLGAEHDRPAGRAGRRAVRGGVVPGRRREPPGVHPAVRARRRGSLPAARPRASSAIPSCAGGCASSCTGGSATSPPSRASTRPSTCRGSCTATRRSSGSGSRSASTSPAARRTSSCTTEMRHEPGGRRGDRDRAQPGVRVADHPLGR